MATILLIGTLAYVARDNFRFGPATQPVRPADRAALDPEVLELVDAKLAEVERDPSSGRAHGSLGLVYEANELWPEAAASLAIAADLDPDEGLWVYHQALATRRAGDPAAGLVLLQDAADRLPGEVGVQLRLGYELLDEGRLDAAEAAFARVVRQVPGRPEGYAGRGELALARGDYQGAVSVLQRALSLDEAPRIAHYSLGLAFRELGRMDEAERELTLGLGAERQHIGDRFFPQVRDFAVNYASTVERASELLDSGSPEGACRLLEGLLARRPDDLNLLNNLAVAYLGVGKIDEAERLLEHALALDEGAFATHQNLAACAMQGGDFAKALDHAERASQLAAAVASTHVALMQAQVALGQFDAARASASTALRLDPADVSKHVAVAELCMRLGRYPEARTGFETVLDMAPGFLPAQLNLITVLILMGDLEEAETALRVAEKSQPGHERVEFVRRALEDARANPARSDGK